MKPFCRRSWRTFSLRSLLLIVFIVCLASAWVGEKVSRGKQEAAAVRRLRQRPLVLDYDYEYDEKIYVIADPPGPQWLRELLGEFYFQHVIRVTAVGNLFQPAASITDEHMYLLHDLPRLKEVDFSSTAVTDKGLLYICDHCPQLRDVDVSYNDISDDGLCKIAHLNHIERLCISGCRITDNGLVWLQDLKCLDELWLGHTQITDVGIGKLTKLTELGGLFLGHTQISDMSIRHFRKMQHLDCLDIEGTNMTPGGVEELRRVLPNCVIFSDQ